MKIFRWEIYLTLLVLMLLPAAVGHVSAQLLYENSGNQLIQVNQPVTFELGIASQASIRGKIDFPVSLVRLTASGSQQISLEDGIGEALVEVFRQVCSADFNGLKQDVHQLAAAVEQSLPRAWRSALAGAYAAFLALLFYFFRARIDAATEVFTAAPGRTLLRGLFATVLLVLAIGLFGYSVVGIFPALVLLAAGAAGLAVAPAVAVGILTGAVGGRAGELRGWLLFLIGVTVFCLLMTVRPLGWILLVVAFVLSFGTIRGNHREENVSVQEARDEKAV